MALSKEFYIKLNKISSELGMNPRDLLIVMYFESGLNPSILNHEAKRKKEKGAVGLIQFMPETLKGLGVPKNEIDNFGDKSGEEQLDWVKKYVQGQMGFAKRSFKSCSEYYHANFFPLTLTRWRGQDPIANANVIVVSKDSNDRRERSAYSHNAGLDRDKDGHITVHDLTETMMSVVNRQGFQQALAQLNSVAGHGEVTEVAMNPALLKTPRPAPQQFAAKQESSGIEGFLEKINQFFSSLIGNIATANEKQNHFLISVGAEDFVTKTEYARVLQSVLEEELKIDSSIHYNPNQKELELSCSLPFDKKESFEVLNEVCNAVSNVFEFATQKAGGYKTSATILSETSSKYPEMDIKIAEINRRQFKLKIAQGSNANR